jgi:uncharacterized membrane protein
MQTAPELNLVDALRAREQRVVESIRERWDHRDPNAKFEASMTLGQRVADGVAATMGSWRFIIIQSIILAIWIVLNAVELIVRPWDPYPFILLNLMLSFQAAYAAPIIMMSQNRQAAKDRLEAELDLKTNLKAEALIEELHGSIDDLRMQKWTNLLNIQQEQINLLRGMLQRLDHSTAAS